MASVGISMKGQNVWHTGKPVLSARNSTTTPVAVSQEEAQVVDADSDRDSVLHIEVEKVGKKPLAKVKVKTNKQARELICQLDTAASCNVLARRDYEKLDKPKLHNTHYV